MRRTQEIPKVRGGRPARTAVQRAALLAAAIALAPCMPQAEAGRSGATATADDTGAATASRPRRWWLEQPWGHSMQEVAFIAWMDAACNGKSWRVRMPTPQVESVYAWWVDAVWPSIRDNP